MHLPTRRSVVTAPAAAAGLRVASAHVVRTVDVRSMSAREFDAHRPFKTILNGEDITSVCFRIEEYGDGTLRAFCYVKDANGNYVLDSRHNVRFEVRTGRGHVASRVLKPLLRRA